MRNTKNAFTLVELIVVITILAILGTIAFISLQGYSADARNSKRTSDIGNIQSAMNLKQVEGVPLSSFVTGVSDREVTNINLAGTGSEANYAAGTPNYTVLNVDKKDFLDPRGDNEYSVAYTDAQNGVFQLAATLEVDGTDTALVNGTYIARDATSTGTVDSVSGNTITLADANANMFKASDYVTTSSGTVKVLKVSRDGVTLTVNGAVNTGNINLATDEMDGLIGATVGTTGNPVVNLATDDLAY